LLSEYGTDYITQHAMYNSSDTPANPFNDGYFGGFFHSLLENITQFYV
jgi:hypothetical protein